MEIRTAARRAAIAATVAGLTVTLLAGSPAQAEPAADGAELLTSAQTYFAGENALTVTGSDSAANDARAAQAAPVADTFRAERDDRMTAKEQLKSVNDRAGVRYSAVDTELTPIGQARTQGDTARLDVREHTEYTFAGPADAPYSYTVKHRLSFARTGDGQWKLSRIDTRDGAGDLATPKKLTPAELSAAQETAARLASGPGGDAGKVTDPAKKQRSAPEGEVRPTASYDYTAMVDFATKYALAGDDVPYERDENDCTNFVSQALSAGGWEEVYGWYQNDDVWWYNHNWWPLPDNHSYTWGGTDNWQRFARDESKRVYELSGPDSLAIADVVQFEIFGYSDPGQPGHTMMVTDFTSGGAPKMSYHTTDTLNRPLSEIIAKHNDGEEFWYYRT